MAQDGVENRRSHLRHVQSVARHFKAEGMIEIVKLAVPVELPPIGLITVRGRPLTPVTQQLVECLRRAAIRTPSTPRSVRSRS